MLAVPLLVHPLSGAAVLVTTKGASVFQVWHGLLVEWTISRLPSRGLWPWREHFISDLM